jgi:hypothetical protein
MRERGRTPPEGSRTKDYHKNISIIYACSGFGFSDLADREFRLRATSFNRMEWARHARISTLRDTLLRERGRQQAFWEPQNHLHEVIQERKTLLPATWWPCFAINIDAFFFHTASRK